MKKGPLVIQFKHKSCTVVKKGNVILSEGRNIDTVVLRSKTHSL